ncbi:MAG: GTPase/DUF3482 domain-containing protein [Pseudohongiellaceae bacterium]|nr:GTPase/DUF3482 domain-containing protein [Pseudohongiellaceae bacterium]
MTRGAAAIQVAVVGHTNTGKTSLLRTLMRDVSFGEVSARPSTTRHVELARMDVGGEALVEFYDTPGMEDSISLLKIISDLEDEQARKDPSEAVRRFLDTEHARGLFEQEAKVIRQLLSSDVALYVIDARDPVLAKHRDELSILARCAIPILPLLNFVADKDSKEAQWREALAKLNMHAVVSFDTVAPAAGAEQLLYSKMATLMDAHASRFERIQQNLDAQAKARREAAVDLLARLLVDVAAYPYAVNSNDDVPEGMERLYNKIRKAEQFCVDRLLSLYGFNRSDLLASELPMSDGVWEDDLFDPATLTSMGIKFSGGAAAGAATGLGVDLILGGTTLGTAAAIGAVIGGGTQTLRYFGRRMGDKIGALVTGVSRIRVGDEILQILVTRQLYLIKLLELRAHASQEKMTLTIDAQLLDVRRGELAKLIATARTNPEWSSIEKEPHWSDARQRVFAGMRQEFIAALAQVKA